MLDIETTNFGPISTSGFVVPTGGGGSAFNGNTFYVNESTGSDGSSGSSTSPLKTLDAALAACTANNNDVVYFTGTQHRTSTLVWNKAQTHLIGICAPIRRGKRARISVSGSTGFNMLVSVTAAGCCFANFGTFFGWTDAATALLAWSDTGGRSSYENVEFLGFGDGTASTGSSNLTGSRALKFNTSTGESTFQDCVFGVDTESRNATNYTVEIAGGAPRLTFENCDFEAMIGASGTASSHVLIGAAGIDRYVNFKSCRFLNAVDSTATAMAQGFNVSSSAGGTVLLDQCAFNGITAIQTTPTSNMRMNMTLATTGGGLAHQVF